MEQQPKRQPSRKARLNPMKLLTLFLYGSYPYMTVHDTSTSDTRTITIRVGAFAKLLRVRISHIIDYLEWLEGWGYISLKDSTKKTITLDITKPRLFE